MEELNVKIPTDIQVSIPQFLEHMEAESKNSRTLHDLGVDTEMVSFLRELLSAPQNAINKMAELPAQMYLALLVKALKESGAGKIIHEIGVHFLGSTVSLWVFLKESEYNLENRFQVYRLISFLGNLDALSKVQANLLVLKEGEIPLPTDFKSLSL